MSEQFAAVKSKAIQEGITLFCIRTIYQLIVSMVTFHALRLGIGSLTAYKHNVYTPRSSNSLLNNVVGSVCAHFITARAFKKPGAILN